MAERPVVSCTGPQCARYVGDPSRAQQRVLHPLAPSRRTRCGNVRRVSLSTRQARPTDMRSLSRQARRAETRLYSNRTLRVRQRSGARPDSLRRVLGRCMPGLEETIRDDSCLRNLRAFWLPVPPLSRTDALRTAPRSQSQASSRLVSQDDRPPMTSTESAARFLALRAGLSHRAKAARRRIDDRQPVPRPLTWAARVVCAAGPSAARAFAVYQKHLAAGDAPEVAAGRALAEVRQ
jgi:hypothetical protein